MRFCVACVSLLLCFQAYAQSPVRDESHPLVLHAEGRLLLAEGKHQEALHLFRKAHQGDPQDKQIAYDLAQTALLVRTDQFKQDVAPFMALEATSVPTWLLRSYVAKALGQQDKAEECLIQAKALGYSENQPQPSHALGHVEVQNIHAAPKVSLKHLFSARLKTVMGYDTNVNVYPDTALKLQAPQSILDLMGSYALVHPRFTLHLLGGTVYAPYLSGKEELRLYNMGFSYAQLSFKVHHGAFDTMLQASASTVYIDDYRKHFMDALRFYAEERYTGHAVKPAWYVSTELRDFDYFNAENQPLDRDGVRVETGLTADYSLNIWKNTLLVGWQHEQSQGSYYREQGIRTRFQTGLDWEKISVFTSLSHESRFHKHTSNIGVFQDEETSHNNTIKRVDHRVTYELNASFLLYAHTRLYMSYMYVRNFSNTLFKYERNVAQLGLELRW
jgi:tetratricopeptide (TPR) repeat protein